MNKLFPAVVALGLVASGAAFAVTAPNYAGFTSPSVLTVGDDAGREGVSATTPGSSDPGNVAATNNHSENPLDKSGTSTDPTTPTPSSDATKQSDITNKSSNTNTN